MTSMALEQAILRQDPSLLSGPALAPSAANCPWQGLKPYGEGDADRFFGRENDVDACLEILRRTALLVLVGPSGCGKSSLLHAGVAATLRARGQAHGLDHAGHPPDAGDHRAGSGTPATRSWWSTSSRSCSPSAPTSRSGRSSSRR